VLRADRHALIFAQDETDLLLFPPLRAAWSLVGQPKRVLITGRNAKRVLFGALILVSGRRLLLPRFHQRAEDFQAFLFFLRSHHPQHRIALLLDEDSSHIAQQSQEDAASLEIELLWLPHRSPHLNPADSLWRVAKQEVCANYQEADIDSLMQKFIAHLRRLSPEQALRTAGVFSPHFWLKSILSKFFCGPT
jgi:transposase